MKIWRVIPLAIKTWPQWKPRSDLRQHLEKKRTTLQRLSLHSSHGAQVWKLGSRGSVQWLFTFFLIVPASPSSQSIHYLSGYCSSPPSWWWGLTKKKKRRKRLLKTGAVEQSLETPPRLDPPVQEHDLLLGFYEACSVNTNSLALFFFSFHALSVLKCTDVNKHAVAARGKTISHEEKPHNEHTFCCRLAGFLVRGNEAGPNQTASGGILRQTYVLCTFDVLFSAA